ncbi:hypothetical protein RJ639_028784 [Escallonia herrerae]|uniref:Reticulon-like protein n=1 Tax=Escallonia herrerae TaxID=1293975 RepID=A0AA89BEB9_9ASTE|nr:hypothetical protein RJ639_028784 [Escallonia herrerae]
MDSSSPPPYHLPCPKTRPKSPTSRLARINTPISQEGTPPLSLQLVPSETTPSSSPSKPLPLRELLLLSPSPLRRSRTRLAERLEMVDDPAEVNGSRRRCKARSSAVALQGCASPRNNRRSRRRLEAEIREERDLGPVDDLVKPRKRRNVGRPKKEKLNNVPSIPSPRNDGDECNLERIGQVIIDLIMWNDVAKSSLWFGFGSLCFLSSCFARGIDFSIFTVISQLALLFLGVSFCSNSICQRYSIENKREIKLREDDILSVARLILPAANLAISKTRELFSGEPSMTLKVAPFLLIGAEYGRLITLWRLCALGFFISFTCPKLYSCYSVQLDKRVEHLKSWVLETWEACAHKKIVAASATTAFWNLTTIKTRIFAAFMSLVLVRYCRQYSGAKADEGDGVEAEEELPLQQQALVVVGSGLQQQ